jgi:hypothetical protein
LPRITRGPGFSGGVARVLPGKAGEALADYEQTIALNPDRPRTAEKRDER